MPPIANKMPEKMWSTTHAHTHAHTRPHTHTLCENTHTQAYKYAHAHSSPFPPGSALPSCRSVCVCEGERAETHPPGGALLCLCTVNHKPNPAQLTPLLPWDWCSPYCDSTSRRGNNPRTTHTPMHLHLCVPLLCWCNGVCVCV